MPGWIEKLIIQLLLALGDRVIAEGSEYYKDWKSVKEATERALKYQRVVDNDQATREERERAEDELGG